LVAERKDGVTDEELTRTLRERGCSFDVAVTTLDGLRFLWRDPVGRTHWLEDARVMLADEEESA
jgi:hypothetical protein